MKTEKITPARAKKIMQAALEERELPYEKLTARTVNFTDLARGGCVFVKIHGWKPRPSWDHLKKVAKENGFCIES